MLDYTDVPFCEFLSNLDIQRNYMTQQWESYSNMLAALLILDNYVACIETARRIMPYMFDPGQTEFIRYTDQLQEHIQYADLFHKIIKEASN